MSGLRLYLIRHGIAVERSEFPGPDRDRPLTPQGQQKTAQVAQRLYALNLRFDHLLTSPLLRAQQTATILKAAKLTPRIEVSEMLAPQGNFGDWLNWLADWQNPSHKSLALVGHEPDLSQWAEVLLWSEAQQVILLKKAGIIGLELPPAGSVVGNSRLFWLAAPGLLL
jgi:phosphohistidine phosphatase